MFPIAQMEELLLEALDDIKKAMELLDGLELGGAAAQNKSTNLSIEILSILNYVYKQLYAKATDAGSDSRGGNPAANMADSAAQEEQKGDGGDAKGKKKGGIANEADEEEEPTNLDKKVGGKGGPNEQEAENEVQKDIELIVPYLLDLLFDKLLKTMQGLTFNQIKLEYWDYALMNDKGPPADLFD